jgi:hypothetical protein
MPHVQCPHRVRQTGSTSPCGAWRSPAEQVERDESDAQVAFVACLMLVSLVVASPATAATTQAFDARLNEGFRGATAHPCPPQRTSRSAAPV